MIEFKKKSVNLYNIMLYHKLCTYYHFYNLFFMVDVCCILKTTRNHIINIESIVRLFF